MDSMFKTLLAFVSLLTATALPAASETGAAPDPVVIEVFSSHNCAACPKAHANMAEVEAARDDVLIMTWSVDYWDYLGAPDPMAIPEARERQVAYADRFELRGPYTPQTVYDGAKQCAGNKMRRVERTLDRLTRNRPPRNVAFLEAEDGSIRLSNPQAHAVDVKLIHFAELPESPMVNPVRAVDLIEPGSDGRLDVACDGRCALVAQVPGFGPIEAARLLD